MSGRPNHNARQHLRKGAPVPYRPLAGVEPCPGGWLVVPGKLQGVSLFPEPPQVITIEEPERGLHPYLMGKLVDLLRVVVPHGYFVLIELVKAWESTKGVKIVVENRNLHGASPSCPLAIKYTRPINPAGRC